MTHIRGLLQDEPSPADSATPAARLAWLRAQIRLSARAFAMRVMFDGADEQSADDDLGLIADGFADMIGVSDDVIRVAIEAEQQDAAALLIRCADELHRRVYLLGREHAPGQEIMAAARSICDKLGVFIPTPVLLARVRAIAHPAAMLRRRRHVA